MENIIRNNAFQKRKPKSIIFFVPAIIVCNILMFQNIYHENVYQGQDHGLQHSQWHHSMENIKFYKCYIQFSALVFTISETFMFQTLTYKIWVKVMENKIHNCVNFLLWLNWSSSNGWRRKPEKIGADWSRAKKSRADQRGPNNKLTKQN